MSLYFIIIIPSLTAPSHPLPIPSLPPFSITSHVSHYNLFLLSHTPQTCICLSGSSWIHLTQWSPVPFTLLRTAWFHFYDWKFSPCAWTTFPLSDRPLARLHFLECSSRTIVSAVKTQYLCGTLAQHPSEGFPRGLTRVMRQFWCSGFEEPPHWFLFWLHKFTFPSSLNKSSFSFGRGEKASQSVLIRFCPMDGNTEFYIFKGIYRNIEFFFKLFTGHFKLLFYKLI